MSGARFVWPDKRQGTMDILQEKQIRSSILGSSPLRYVLFVAYTLLTLPERSLVLDRQSSSSSSSSSSYADAVLTISGSFKVFPPLLIVVEQ